MHLLDLISTLQTPYCEHLGLRSFTEPINAISNLAFLFAAYLAMRQVRELPEISAGARLLPWSLAAVAIGSFLYHSFRSPITYLIDILPLGAFMVLVICLSLRRLKAKISTVIIAGLAFLSLQIIALIYVPNNFLNGSTPYLVALSSIPPIMFLTSHHRNGLFSELATIAILFAIALFFRSADRAICSWLPIGTHFLWHITSAIAAYHAVRFVIAIGINE